MSPFNVISSGRSVRKRLGTFTDCTHIFVSLLYAWKVAMVRTECDYVVFPRYFKKVQNKKLLFDIVKAKSYKKAKMKGGLGWIKKYL